MNYHVPLLISAASGDEVCERGLCLFFFLVLARSRSSFPHEAGGSKKWKSKNYV